MSDHSRAFRKLSEQWEALFDAGKFDDAIEVGIKSYLTFRKIGEKKWSDGSLGLIAVTIPSALGGEEISGADTSLSCSFCSQPGTKDTLVAGPNANICGTCATLAIKILNKNNSSDGK